ncbi:hypothetical protein RHSIM_Rhsim07G0212300 [Rhododendron simsii]|uniref:Uncharacterized protein n=1 Tax=Rhododendron simsii TaxID=118357 RepID=A0A834GR01_RHOSS|nr:hypothetical protein RHSIM_Rhsim07G0212300 [Rhododendron simsii]
MEESEKRRERLKAMRMEASQSGVEHVVGNSAVPHHLSNPLVETSPIPPLQNNAPRRFDYYTDPMAAFSADNRRSKVSNQNSQDYFTPPRPMNPEMTPSPVHQVQPNYSPDQRIYQPQGPYHSSGPMSPPLAHQAQANYSPDQRMYQARGPYHSSGPMTPSPAHQLPTNYTPDPRMYQARGPYPNSGPMTASPAHQSQTNYSPDQRMYRARGPYQSSRPDGSPMGMVGPSGSHQGSSGASTYYHSANSPGIGNFSSPSFGGSPRFGGPTSSLGFRGSPSSYSGRGRGRSSGRGRGFGSHESVSAELRPDLYYNKSMVEDPWKLLTPVIWKRQNISAMSGNVSLVDYAKSAFPGSAGIKKPRISGGMNESSSSSQPSLAEYLAAAFNEAANDGAGNNDKPSL